MNGLLQLGAAGCAALGLVSTAAVLLRAGGVRLGVRVLLEFLLAAGVLRLAADPGWRDVAAASALLVVRVLVR